MRQNRSYIFTVPSETGFSPRPWFQATTSGKSNSSSSSSCLWRLALLQIAISKVRAIQEEETKAENITEEEITEQLIFEESAEFLPYAEDCEQSMPEEKQEDTDY